MIEDLARLDVLGWVSHYAIVLLRTVGLFVFLPIFGSDILPIKIRMIVASVVAFAFLPFAPPLAVPPADLASWAIVGVRELSAGLGLGIAARMLFAGVEAAAQLVAGQSGFSLAAMVDPSSGDQSAAPNMFMNLLAISVFLAADLHHLFLMGIHNSYQLLPSAIALPHGGALDRFTSLLGLRLFSVAVELAAPALVVTVTVDLVMVLVGKAMPQIPILIVGYPFKMAVGLLALGLLAIGTASAMGWIGRTLASDGAALMAAFGGT